MRNFSKLRNRGFATIGLCLAWAILGTSPLRADTITSTATVGYAPNTYTVNLSVTRNGKDIQTTCSLPSYPTLTCQWSMPQSSEIDSSKTWFVPTYPSNTTSMYVTYLAAGTKTAYGSVVGLAGGSFQVSFDVQTATNERWCIPSPCPIFNNGANQAMNAGSGKIGMWSMDVDGDGRKDIVQAFSDAGYLNLITYISNGAGFKNGIYKRMNAGSGNIGIWAMDVNGDGKMDLVQGWNDSNYLHLITYLSNGAGFNNGTSKRTNNGYGNIGIWAMDVDGDKKMDLVQGWNDSNNLNLITYFSNGAGFNDGTSKRMNAGYGNIGIWAMDVNGDKKIDLVQAFSDAGYLNLITYLSNGSGFNNGIYKRMNAGSGNIGIWAMDVNGDGKKDLVQGFDDKGHLDLIAYRSNGSGFDDGIYQLTGAGSSNVGFLGMDVDGDRWDDLVQVWDNLGTLNLFTRITLRY